MKKMVKNKEKLLSLAVARKDSPEMDDVFKKTLDDRHKTRSRKVDL